MKKNLLMWDESLFRDPEVFEIDYLPEQFEFRDTQMQELAFQIRPGLRAAGRSIRSARACPVRENDQYQETLPGSRRDDKKTGAGPHQLPDR